MGDSVTVQQYFVGLVHGFLNMPMEYLSTGVAIVYGIFIWTMVWLNGQADPSLRVLAGVGRVWRSWRYRVK